MMNKNATYAVNFDMRLWVVSLFLAYIVLIAITIVSTILLTSAWISLVTVPLVLFFAKVFGFMLWPASKIYWLMHKE